MAGSLPGGVREKQGVNAACCKVEAVLRCKHTTRLTQLLLLSSCAASILQETGGGAAARNLQGCDTCTDEGV
jgi:hypothetical protein